jgi:hypothetical protein
MGSQTFSNLTFYFFALIKINYEVAVVNGLER